MFPFPPVRLLPFTMKLRTLRFSLLVVAISLFLPNPALAAGTSLFSDNVDLSYQAPNADAQTPQDNSLSSVPPPSVGPDTVLVANAADSDNPHASCANSGDGGSKNQKLRIRNGESCAADGGATNRLKLPGWATPWRTKKTEAVEEPNDYDSCLGVDTPAGMALPYHLCCLGIAHALVNGVLDRISQCVFDFSKCDSGSQLYTLYSQDVCCQTFSIELGSEYATGINCLPRI